MGLVSHSRTFGYAPREPLRRDFCHTAGLAYGHPAEHAALCAGGAETWEWARGVVPPAMVGAHEALVATVPERWRFPDAPFTSGIANLNNPLGFHRDSGNFPGSLSTMIVTHASVDGGVLVFPEYRVGIRLPGVSVYVFCGSRIVHGVTRIKPKGSLGFRRSVVYYALQNMCNCLSPEEELARTRKLKTERMRKRVKA